MCNKGSECIYSHDKSLSNRGTLPCKYFSTGTCAYGDNCRFSHEMPFPGFAQNNTGNEQKSFISNELNVDTPISTEDQQITPLYPPLLQPQQISIISNDGTMVNQYGYTYEPSAEPQNFIMEDSHVFPTVPSESNSYYNEDRIGGEDSGVGEDLTYQFDASLNLDQVPNLPENQISSTPNVFWASTDFHRSITPAITSPYSPPPYSDTSWANAPVFVPNNVYSHKQITHSSPRDSSKSNESEVNFTDKSNSKERESLSEHGSHLVMPHYINNSYDMPHIPLLMPSNATVIGVDRNDIYNSGHSTGVTNVQEYPPGPTNNHYPNFQQQSIISSAKPEITYDNHNFQTFYLNSTRNKELPPPPPPQMSKTETSDKESTPKAKTWAQVVNSSCPSDNNKIAPTIYKSIEKAVTPTSIADAESQLCPFSLVGECRYGEHCAYVHGLICDLCGTPSLHPNHEEQRKRHQEVSKKITFIFIVNMASIKRQK